MGVAASTWDQCDQCWGSGVEGRPWPSVRELGVQRADWEAEQVYEYLRERLGIRFFAKRIMSLADMADRETKRRKFPEGEDPFFFTRDWESVSALLRKLAAKDPQP